MIIFFFLFSYPKSEAKRINALMNSKQAQACVQSAQDIIQSLKHGDFGRDSSKLRYIVMLNSVS